MTQLEILHYAIIGVIDKIDAWTEEAIDSENEAWKAICDAIIRRYEAELRELQKMEEEIIQVYEEEGLPYPSF